MPRRSLIRAEENTEINLSPMIDCIFILLIFFIVTTVFVEEQGLTVDKPDAAATASTEEDETVTLEKISQVALIDQTVVELESAVSHAEHKRENHHGGEARPPGGVAGHRGGAVALHYACVHTFTPRRSRSRREHSRIFSESAASPFTPYSRISGVLRSVERR